MLTAIWNKLGKITKLTFEAKSQSESGWSGKGRGEVVVEKAAKNVLIFREKGSWKNERGQQFDFNNIFRWELSKTRISLEHLRFGNKQPVFLFELAPVEHALASVDVHLCGEDFYSGQISLDDDGLCFIWKVTGPKKDEEIIYHYK